MAIKADVNLKNGLNIKGAIVVICSLVDSRNEQYNYQVAQPSPGQTPPQYRPHENAQPNRSSYYQAWIFASEQHLRDGQPPIGFLPCEETAAPNHRFALDDKSELSKIDQAYEDLRKKFPESTDLDISEFGLK